MLIFDGHESHVSLEFLDFCTQNRIIPVQLPPHTTHLLQPLDVGVFAPLQQRYTAIVDNQIVKSEGRVVVNKRRFYSFFREAYLATMKSTTIISAWRKAGLYPINVRVVLSQQLDIAPKTPTKRPTAALPAEPAPLQRLRTPAPSSFHNVRQLIKLIPNSNVIAIKLAHTLELAMTENFITQMRFSNLKEEFDKQQQVVTKNRRLVRNNRQGLFYSTADVVKMKEDRRITDIAAKKKQKERAAAKKATAERKAAKEAAKLQRDARKQHQAATSARVTTPKVTRQLRQRGARQTKAAARPLFAITLGEVIE
jgi:hypothetical protein